MIKNELIQKMHASFKISTNNDTKINNESSIDDVIITQNVKININELKKFARTKSNEILNNKISESSQKQYRKTGLMLEQYRSRLGEAINIDSFLDKKNTFYKYRAALRFQAAEQIKVCLNELDYAHRNKDDNRKNLAFLKLQQYVDDLKKYDDGIGHLGAKVLYDVLGTQHVQNPASTGSEPVDKSVDKPVRKHRTTSKLKDTKKINIIYPNWRNLVIARLVEIKSNYLYPVCVMALTGCRPAELSNISIHIENNIIEISIKGAKTRKVKGLQLGQPWRLYRLKDDGSAEFKHILEMGDRDLTEKITANNISGALLRVGGQVLPNAPKMSAYVYRHALACDLKADKLSPTIIAKALGHSATRTQQMYGAGYSGKAGNRKMAVEATNDVRITHDPSFGQARTLANEDVIFKTVNFDFDA